MKRSNYYDQNGVGLFTKWFKNEEMEIDDMEEELQDDNVDDCGYLEFDDNFPLDPLINDKDKQAKIFEIIQYCYKHGKPPSSKKGKEKENSNKKSNKNSGSYDDGSQVNKSFIVDLYWNPISPKKLDKAIEEGKLEVLKYWKKQGMKIKDVRYQSKNALHIACEYGKLHIVKWLIDEYGFNLEETDMHGSNKTALFYAVMGGSIEVLEFLKGKKAKMNVIAGYSNKNLLCWACEAYDTSVLNYKNDDEKKDKIEVIKWLLNHSNRTKGSDFYINVEFATGIGVTPFLWAAQRGLLAITQLLKKKGANIHAKDKYGNNALHLVCLSGDIEMIIALLDKCEIDIEAKGQYQRSPFLFAAEKGQLAIAKLLRQRGANINAQDAYGNNALHYACSFSGSAPMVTWLLDVCKIEIEVKGQYQSSPFLFAVDKGQFGIAKLLKQRGASVNAKDEYGNNALHLACKQGRIKLIPWLLDVCMIGLETKGYNQRTPFLCAVKGNQLETAKLLRKRGANVNAKDIYGNNALGLAWS